MYHQPDVYPKNIQHFVNVIEYPLKIIPYSTEILNVTNSRVSGSYMASINTFHGRRVV